MIPAEITANPKMTLSIMADIRSKRRRMRAVIAVTTVTAVTVEKPAKRVIQAAGGNNGRD